MLDHWLPCQMLVEFSGYDYGSSTWGAYFDYALYAGSYGQNGTFEYVDSSERQPWEAPDFLVQIASMAISNGSELKFTLQTPVACVIRWRTGRLDVDEFGYPTGTTTWDAEQELIVSVSASETITVAPDIANLDVAEVLGVRFHPWS